MLKIEIARDRQRRVVLMDSITKVAEEDRGAIVVSASHGGTSSGEFALQIPLRAVFFNDAGGGKDNAGIAALAMLQQHGIAAATVSHSTARIGDALDMWEHGVISHTNEYARAAGYRPGVSLQAALGKDNAEQPLDPQL